MTGSLVIGNGRLVGSISGRGRSRTNHAHVVQELGLGIVEGHFAPGSILPGDADLMARFGVSRTVLREALKTLEAKGLVQPKARIGTRVMPASHWNLFDPDTLSWHFQCGLNRGFLASLAEIRLALEPEAAALAALRRSPEDVADLYRLAAAMNDPANTGSSFANHDLEFHLVVARASGNPFMRSISALIEAALSAALNISSPADDPAKIAISAADHRAIAARIEAGDADGARAAMRRVIMVGADRVAGAFGVAP
ncbi:GntR family transcriptional regulator [Tistrella bauzanensis]|uniref:GntR family transcriptional regulator n=1 Tax=Tistrella bauzanensis TaxID=657419 RepID=A0ABQ1IHI6_9PROT|nr:FadR/GntR family transcriptional regulator [Tistrella bauzanensis]GGB36799.1 GntR family transcriptional regulator [Tistrella bauzanensis]